MKDVLGLFPMNEYLTVFTLCILLASVRYLAMTGIYYGIVYKTLGPTLRRFKIDPQSPGDSDVHHEIKWGLINNINFGLIGAFTFWLYQKGYLKIYTDFDRYPLWHYLALTLILLALHDAYFFWLHYLMHKTRLGKWLGHNIHHHVENVSPWSAFSVDPREGFMEVLFRPIILILIPIHPWFFVFFELLTFALNIIGHSGYEFFPRFFATHASTRMKSCATFHYLHHVNGNTNFSLFLNFWDRVMGTMNPRYETFYQSVMEQRTLDLADAAELNRSSL
jgi:lathosterol oxidase